MYVNIKTMQLTTFDEILQNNPTVSFSPYITNENLIPFGYAVVSNSEQPTILSVPPSIQVPLFKRSIMGSITEVDGEYIMNWKIIDIPQIEYDDVVESILGSLKNKIDTRLDMFCKQRGYDSILHALTYINSSVSDFSFDARVLSDFRDRCWLEYNNISNELKSKTCKNTYFEELVLRIPSMNWDKVTKI